MTGITVSHVDDVLVAVKQAADPDARARLRQEATVLARLDHPGVVRLVGFDEGPPATLRMGFVGPDSWAHLPPTGDERLAGLAIVLATVADLHDAGVRHGALSPAHVLVGPDRRPILCGLGDAGPATAAGVAHDRDALAQLTDGLGDDDPVLDVVASELRTHEVPLRTIVRRLDTRSTAPTASPRRFRMPPVRPIHVAVAATVSLLGLSTVVLWPGAETPTVDAPIVAAPAETTTSTTVVPPTTTIAATAVTVADDAPVVDHAGRRYAIGEPGDVVVLGDWTCDGTPTPAVLRPTTGAVAVFAEWPAPGEQIVASHVTTIDGADAFVTSDAPCPEVRVRTAAGSHLIDLPEH